MPTTADCWPLVVRGGSDDGEEVVVEMKYQGKITCGGKCCTSVPEKLSVRIPSEAATASSRGWAGASSR